MTFNCYASTLATLAKNNMQKKLSMRFLTTVFLLIGLLAAKSADAFPLQLPAGSSATGNTPLEQARRSFMGNDLAGKNGPMRKVGPDLALIFHEHRDYLARGGLAKLKHKFKPSHPLIRFKDDLVVVDVVANDDVNKLKADLQSLGMVDIEVYGRFISGRLPIVALEPTANLTSLRFARPAYAKAMTGSVTSQGDAAQLSDVARSNFGVDGTGVVIGSRLCENTKSPVNAASYGIYIPSQGRLANFSRHMLFATVRCIRAFTPRERL